jgi:methionyl-tRNA formyltransferase
VKINTPESLAELRSLEADLFVVAAYGQILSTELLSIPRLGAINVHASLLPRYRGAAPINYAILNGDAETGVSIIQILPRLDAGPILAVARTPIGPKENAGQLEERLARLAVDLLPGVIDQVATGALQPVLQTDALVTRAPKLTKQMGAIDWTRSAAEIDWHIRALQPWPNPYTYLHAEGKPPQRMLILDVQPLESGSPGTAPGVSISTEPSRLIVQAGEGAVEILEIQPDGKRRMKVADFLRGRPITGNDRFGPEDSHG